MDELLNCVIPQDELERFEKKYAGEFELNGYVTTETKSDYAFCLVRSKYTNDIRKGIILLEDLARIHPDGKRDYIYHLAFANTRIKNYSQGLKYCRAFLEAESNSQVYSLEQYIKSQKDKDIAKAIVVGGAAVLALSGILGFGIALARK